MVETPPYSLQIYRNAHGHWSCDRIFVLVQYALAIKALQEICSLDVQDKGAKESEGGKEDGY